jgi:uncharacterized HAD superfamily protein
VSKKPIIAVDIDDVLAAEAEFIIAYSNENWGHSLSLEDYKENWGEMWGLDHDAVERRADTLHQTDLVMMYRTIDGAHQALLELKKNYDLIILTSRRRLIQAETSDWIAQNFGDIFDEIHYTGFWDTKDPGGHLRTKGKLLEEIGADYVIDDQSKHCIAASECGIKAILFGDYAGNRSVKLPSDVVRCKNWKEVLEYFDGSR